MSGDELFALLVSLALGGFGWKLWIEGLLTLKPEFRRSSTRLLATVTPLLSAAVVFFVLRQWAAHDVRSSGVYTGFYLAMWFGWTGAMNFLLGIVGLSCRDDVLERGNPAAGLAVSGAMIGLTVAFAGGNIGDGPGWWVVIFSAGMASATMLGLWIAGNFLSRVADAITIDRDVAAGWRTWGFFVGTGLIVGRAVAGDWHSGGQTVVDFIAKGWWALVLWAIAVGLDVLMRPTPEKPAPNRILCGLLPGLLYLAASVVVVLRQGTWR